MCLLFVPMVSGDSMNKICIKYNESSNVFFLKIFLSLPLFLQCQALRIPDEHKNIASSCFLFSRKSFIFSYLLMILGHQMETLKTFELRALT